MFFKPTTKIVDGHEVSAVAIKAIEEDEYLVLDKFQIKLINKILAQEANGNKN